MGDGARCFGNFPTALSSYTWRMGMRVADTSNSSCVKASFGPGCAWPMCKQVSCLVSVTQQVLVGRCSDGLDPRQEYRLALCSGRLKLTCILPDSSTGLSSSWKWFFSFVLSGRFWSCWCSSLVMAPSFPGRQPSSNTSVCQKLHCQWWEGHEKEGSKA